MPGLALRRLLQSQDSPAQLLVAGGVALLLGCLALLTSPMLVLVGLGTVIGAIALLKRSDIGVLGFLAAYSTILHVDILPLVNIGVGSLNICDIVLIVLLGTILIRALVEPRFRIHRTSLNLPLLIFFGFALLSTAVALINSSVDSIAAVREMRYITYYLAFFVVANLVYEEHALKSLVKGVFVLAGIVALAMIAQFVIGPSTPIIYGRVEQFVQDGDVVSDVARIIPAGRYLLVVAFNVSSLYLLMRRPMSWGAIVYWTLLLVGIVLMFNRNTWIGVAIVLGSFFLVTRAMYRRRMLMFSFAALLALLALFTFAPANPSTPFEKAVASFSTRLLSIFDAATYTEQANTDQNTSSLEFRRIEMQYALPLVIPPPVLGLGMGATYRPSLPQLDSEEFNGRGYIHNAHLWILIKVGSVGYGALMLFFLLAAVRGIRFWRSMPNVTYQALILGFSLTIIAMLVSAVVDPLLADLSWTPVCAVIIGANEVLIRLYSGETAVTRWQAAGGVNYAK